MDIMPMCLKRTYNNPIIFHTHHNIRVKIFEYWNEHYLGCYYGYNLQFFLNVEFFMDIMPMCLKTTYYNPIIFHTQHNIRVKVSYLLKTASDQRPLNFFL